MTVAHPPESVVLAERDYLAEPMLPEEIEAEIQAVRGHITRGVHVVRAAEERARLADRAHSRAFSQAFIHASGTPTEKRHAAEVAPEVVAAQDEFDVAELAYRHAKRIADALDRNLSALQSINKSVTGVYGSTTGFGR